MLFVALLIIINNQTRHCMYMRRCVDVVLYIFFPFIVRGNYTNYSQSNNNNTFIIDLNIVNSTSNMVDNKYIWW